MDEPSSEARHVLAAYRRARAADPALHARVRGRIASSVESRTVRDTNRTGVAIALGLLLAALVVLFVALLWSLVRERDELRQGAPSSAQRDAATKRELPVVTPPAELPTTPTVVERDEHVPPAVTPEAPRRAPERALPTTADLQRELELLRDAKGHRDAGVPAKSLAVLAQHAREFPQGQLAEERDAIAIEIRCKTAERPRARRELETFASTHPSSTHLARLRRACE